MFVIGCMRLLSKQLRTVVIGVWMLMMISVLQRSNNAVEAFLLRCSSTTFRSGSSTSEQHRGYHFDKHQEVKEFSYVTKATSRTSYVQLSSTKNDGEGDEQQQQEEQRGKLLERIMRFRGPVDTGYGRGGKQLGVPTANLGPSSTFREALETVPAGVYFGWATLEDYDNKTKLGRNTVHKAVVNVGYSPTFEGKENPEKIIEAHLILPKVEETDNDSTIVLDPPDFYGETMRLQLDGFLRLEQKFDNFQDLITQINADVQDANSGLDVIPYSTILKEDQFLHFDNDSCWIGSSGGDKIASWEFDAMETIVS